MEDPDKNDWLMILDQLLQESELTEWEVGLINSLRDALLRADGRSLEEISTPGQRDMLADIYYERIICGPGGLYGGS